LLKLYGKDRFELGASAALTSGSMIKSLVRSLSRWARRHPEKLLSQEPPKDISELEGLARGLGIATEDLFCARMLIESLAVPQCTNFGAVPPATKDDDIMVSWNFDAPLILKMIMGRFPLYVRELEGTIPYLCLGAPAVFGIGILNAEGLSCVVNAVGVTDAGEGYSQFELNNRAMETCTTVSEAAEVFSEGPRQATKSIAMGMLMNWNMIWADRHGSLSVFENSHSHFYEQPAGAEGIIASANHHQFLDRDLSGSCDPSTLDLLAGSYSRLARMWALLREHHGLIEPRVANLIVSDHRPDYSLLAEFGIERQWWEEKVDDSTICAHAWNMKKHLLKGEFELALTEWGISTTLYSLQVQPLSMTVWFTNGQPCRNLTTPVYWGKMLGAEVERYPGAVDPADLSRREKERSRRGVFREDASPGEARFNRAWFGVTEAVEKLCFKKERIDE